MTRNAQTLKKRLKCVSERPQKRNESEAELVLRRGVLRARHSFLIFVVFHHSLQHLLVCLVSRLAVRSAHLFFMLR